METAQSMRLTSDNENWYMTYSFAEVIGGGFAAAPIDFIHRAPHVPNGFETRVKVEFLTSDDVLVSESVAVFVAEAEEAKPFFQISPSTVEVYPSSLYRPEYMSKASNTSAWMDGDIATAKLAASP